MNPLEKKKNEIIKLIDDSRQDGRKIAFYSDPLVIEILDKVYELWEKNNRKGIPLDYASPEQINVLYNLALKYSRVSDSEAWALYLRRTVYGTEKENESENKKSRLRSILRFI
ncbi:hypothetical protein [Staphylothermus hellenicus]|uniref:Uncharacterized protein n=1 Tax=Staphylothermus hellenicus (strain DSM 12710 / JCM 10830 / BK20S6-10-b1 / P8) TaxID=591019 RepID=D7D8U6_STAHD|nr:hypothetical protein [Staphylothermus hellenicus]ADI32192.1 hypothetical protein Shell_1089 [Staphylothermus hellenicus DSM 12710]